MIFFSTNFQTGSEAYPAPCSTDTALYQHFFFAVNKEYQLNISHVNHSSYVSFFLQIQR
jgi:hypothetical protein